MSEPYRFYASEISYFSGKVRPALRQKGVRYVEHLPTPAAYRDVILPRTGLGFIPIVVTPDGDTWQAIRKARAGSRTAWAGRSRALGVRPESHAAIEAHTAELLDALSAHFAEQPALLGSRMSLADCALMGPFYAHLYLDAVPGRLVRERALRVCHGIERGARFQRYTSPYTLWMVLTDLSGTAGRAAVAARS